MARNEASDVKAIVATDLDETGILPFLETAAAWVEDQLEDANMSEAILTQIELYLAAHLVTLKDPRVTRVKAGPVDISFLSDKSEAAPTEFLKIAAALDSTGTIGEAFMPSSSPSAIAFVGAGFARCRR